MAMVGRAFRISIELIIQGIAFGRVFSPFGDKKIIKRGYKLYILSLTRDF